jgi:gamma-glutamyltranspeptidase/glutathione hydrolase
MVASTHWLGSATGMAVLEDGGNAFDAAVAAGFVLQVAEPHLNGPGGQVPALFVTESEGRPRVLCGQGVSPAAATPQHFADLGLDLIPGSGLLAATVPAAWDAWLLLLRDHGTKTLRDVLGYAISYAWKGIPVVARITETVDTVAELFAHHWRCSGQLWLAEGGAGARGSLDR